MKQNFWKTVVSAALLVGSLDIIAAIVNFYTRTGKDPQVVLEYIANAILGKEAFSGGTAISALGLLLHFLIAFIWTFFFFWLYPRLKFLSVSRGLTGILFGIFIWFIMSQAVVPMSKASTGAFKLKEAATAALILIGAIGLPLSFIAHKYYIGKSKD